MRRALRLAAFVVGCGLALGFAAAPAVGSPEDDYRASVAAQLVVLDRTDALLAESTLSRQTQLRARVRALYKTVRAESARQWLDRDERAGAPLRRAAARFILRREISELARYRAEIASAAAARVRLSSDGGAPVLVPPAGSLFRPVVGGKIAGGFGEYVDVTSSARLVRHGVDITARAGRNVRAVAAGTVSFVGPLRGLGIAVVVTHPSGIVSILGRLSNVTAAPGQWIDRGQALGEAEGGRIYLEVRTLAGTGGFPIDPEPLLE